MPSLIPLSYLVIFLPPLIAGRLLFFFTEKKQSVSNHSTTYKKPASGSQINFKIIDAGIMNGFANGLAALAPALIGLFITLTGQFSGGLLCLVFTGAAATLAAAILVIQKY